MTIALSKECLWEKVMLYYLVVYSMVSRYIEYGAVWHFFMVIILLRLLNKKYIVKSIKFYFINPIGIFLVILGIMSCVIRGTNILILFENSIHLFFPILYCIVLGIFTREKIKLMKIIFFEKYWIFDAFLWINFIIVILQINGSHIFVKDEWLTSYWEDMCSGVFGNAGTHELSIYAVFVILLNIIRGEVTNNKKRMVIAGIYSLVMCVISMYNDNMFFYVLLSMFVAIFYMKKIMLNDIKIIDKLKNVQRIFFVIGTFVIMIYYFTPIGDYIAQNVMSRMISMVNFDTISYNGGSVERMGMVLEALSLDSTYNWGLGIGMIGFDMLGDETMFVHSSINSLGPFLFIGGIWLTIIYCLFYGYLLTVMVDGSASFISMIVNFSLVVILAFYSPIFNYVHFILWVFFIYSLFAVYRKHVIEANRML